MTVRPELGHDVFRQISSEGLTKRLLNTNRVRCALQKARDQAKYVLLQFIFPRGANIECKTFSVKHQKCLKGNQARALTAVATLLIQRRRQKKSRRNLVRKKLPTVDAKRKYRRKQVFCDDGLQVTSTVRD